MDIKKLTQNFAVPGKVTFVESSEGLIKVQLASAFSTAEVHLQGAHVSSFKVLNEIELLWLSSLSLFARGKAIRGGIPICWPWFGAHVENNKLPQHGFARQSLFSVINIVESTSGELTLSLRMESTPDTLKSWPYEFRFSVDIKVGEQLTVSLTTENTDKKNIILSEAIHSYLNVDNITKIQIRGLADAPYFDKLTNRQYPPSNQSLNITSEIDRIYQPNQYSFAIFEQSAPKILVSQSGANSTVIWNPWQEKAKSLADFPDCGFKNMLCVEAANSMEKIVIQPGKSHTISQTIMLASSDLFG